MSSLQAGFDFKRLPGNTRWGSQAFYRKVATQDARRAMADIIANYERVIKAFKDVQPEVLERALQPIFKKAQAYVPERTGALWESGKLTSGKDKNGKAFANITFGNEEAWYAAIVHEFVWLHHEAPTRAKYLQAAMEEGLDEVLVSIAVDYSGMFG